MKSWINMLRVRHWVKNLMLFFPLFLGCLLTDTEVFGSGVIPFSAFCLASSSTYIFNDLVDAPKDAKHPVKKERPIAAGEISLMAGVVSAVGLAILALVLAIQVGGVFLWILIGYASLSIIYTLKLKDIAVVDLFCISIFFILPLEAGGQAF